MFGRRLRRRRRSSRATPTKSRARGARCAAAVATVTASVTAPAATAAAAAPVALLPPPQPRLYRSLATISGCHSASSPASNTPGVPAPSSRTLPPPVAGRGAGGRAQAPGELRGSSPKSTYDCSLERTGLQPLNIAAAPTTHPYPPRLSAKWRPRSCAPSGSKRSSYGMKRRPTPSPHPRPQLTRLSPFALARNLCPLLPPPLPHAHSPFP